MIDNTLIINFLILLLLIILTIRYCFVFPSKGILKVILSFKKVRFVSNNIGFRIPIFERVYEISYKDLTLDKNYLIPINEDYVFEVRFMGIARILKDIQSSINLCNYFANLTDKEVEKYLFRNVVDTIIVKYFTNVNHYEESEYMKYIAQRKINDAISEEFFKLGYELDCMNVEISKSMVPY